MSDANGLAVPQIYEKITSRFSEDEIFKNLWASINESYPVLSYCKNTEDIQQRLSLENAKQRLQIVFGKGNGCVFRIWRGDWKKNGQQQWHFVPNHQDYGFTMFMDSPETFDGIDAAVRENYMLGLATPIVITYGMPDWMLFPSGPSAPRTIGSTDDLVSLISTKPPFTDITLLVTFGPRNVAEFQFLCRSPFTIGPTTYIIGDGQDQRAKAQYEGLVFGDRLLTSEAVMNEIFGEEEMVILHRVAMEMGFADRLAGAQSSSAVAHQFEIIQLDDDDEMMDASLMVAPGTGNEVATAGAIVPFQPQPLTQIPVTAAPSVLWDVGLDLLDYPEFYNAQRDGRLVNADAAFWDELIDENYQHLDGIFIIPSTNNTEVSMTQNETMVGGGLTSESGDMERVGLSERDGESSTGPSDVICSQLGLAKASAEVAGAGNGEPAVQEEIGTTQANVATPPNSVTLTLSLGSGTEAPQGQRRPYANPDNTSSEGSDAEGGF